VSGQQKNDLEKGKQKGQVSRLFLSR